MCLYHQAIQSQKRCPAVFAEVKIFQRFFQCRFYKQRSDLLLNDDNIPSLIFLIRAPPTPS